MISKYKELIFWQRSHEVCLLLLNLCRMMPKERIADIICSQIIRSAFSVGANIAEGFGRYKTKEYDRFLQIALGSANETDYWLTIFMDAYPQFKNEVGEVQNKNEEVIRMLAKSLQTLRKNKQK